MCAVGGGEGEDEKGEAERFGTFTRELLELADWLRACGVTQVATEARDAGVELFAHQGPITARGFTLDTRS